MLWIGFIICNHWGLLKIRHTNHPFLKKMFFNYKSFNLWDSWCQYPSFTFSLAKKKITWERKGSPYPHSHLNSVPCAQNSARHSQSGLTLFKSCLPFPPLRSAPYPLPTHHPTAHSLPGRLFPVPSCSEFCCVLTSHTLPAFKNFPLSYCTTNLRWHLVIVDVKKRQLNEVTQKCLWHI